MDKTSRKFGAPALLVDVCDILFDSGPVVALKSVDKHSLVLIQTESSVQIVNPVTERVYQLFELPASSRSVLWSVSDNAEWAAIAIGDCVRLLQLSSGAFYKEELDEEVTALAFKSDSTELLVCIDGGRLLKHQAGDNGEYFEFSEIPAQAGIIMGESFSVSHEARSHDEQPFVVFDPRNVTSKGEVSFTLSPEGLLKLAKAAYAYGSVEQEVEVTFKFAEGATTFGIYEDSLGLRHLLSSQGFMSSIDAQDLVSLSSVAIDGAPITAYHSPKNNFILIVSDRDCRLLNLSFSETLLVKKRKLTVDVECERAEQWSQEEENLLFLSDSEAYYEEAYGAEFAEFFEPFPGASAKFSAQVQIPVAAFSSDDSLLVLGWEDGCIETYSLDTFGTRKESEFTISGSSIKHLQVIDSADGPLILAGDSPSTIGLWNQLGEKIWTNEITELAEANSVNFLNYEKALLFGTSEGKVFISRFIEECQL